MTIEGTLDVRRCSVSLHARDKDIVYTPRASPKEFADLRLHGHTHA